MKQVVHPFTYLKNEQQQLALIHDYQLMNGEPDVALNRTLRLMQKYFQMPMVALVFFGKDNPFFKASIGLPADVRAIDLVCYYQYHCFKQIFVVLDMEKHETLCHHPLRVVEPFIRFYASIPICVKDREGNMAMVGKLCLMDNKSHDEFDSEQQKVLSEFADNITDILKLNQKRYQAKQENDLRVAFLENMSHEILTPTSSLKAILDLFDTNQLNDEQKQYLVAMKVGCDSIFTTTNDMVELANLLSGKVKFNKRQVNIREFSQAILNNFVPDAQQKGVNVQLLCDTKLPENVVIDTQKVRQVLTSLVKNALAFTKNHGNVLLRLTKRGESFIDFQVINTGLGISLETQAVIFDAYHYADRTTHRVYGGLGLTLSLSKAFANIMGGSMKVSSKEGEWTSFTLRLPLECDVAEKVVEPLESVSQSAIPAHVLVVDDCSMTLMKTKAILKKFGYTFDVAINGQQAVEMMMSNPTAYQLILMDHQMPIMDGVTATRVLKEKLDNLPPIIAVTAHATHGDTNIYLDVGMQDYLAKPVKDEELHAKMQYWLERQVALC